jgi:polyisoprenoid-binding protein YceI
MAPADGSVSDGHGTKLKRVSTGFKIPLLAAVIGVLAVSLLGCPTRPRAPSAPIEKRAIPGQSSTQTPGLPHEGRPYDIASGESLLTILVFRGGALAKAGHNHVIASHALRGTLYVPADLARSTFEVRLPVTELTVDEEALRAKENEADFPADVSDSAKDGTRRNMLGGALLDAEHNPEIVLRSSSLEAAPDAAGANWVAHVEVTVRDRTSSVVVPMHYEQHADEIVVSGQFPLKQTDLGLTPFSALLGALQVVDEMKVRFRIVARAAATQTGR